MTIPPEGNKSAPTPNYFLYESKKRELWASSLTPEQYEKAILKIARECGV